jgi:hypothetical protein
MNINTMTSTLSSLGIQSSTWIFNKDILTINLLSDAAHEYDYYSQRLYFDVTTGILKIKYYDFKLVSTELFNVEKIANSTLKIKHDLFGYYGLKYKNLDKIRNLKIGDIIYTVNRTTGQFVEAATITAIDQNILNISNDITITAGVYVCYTLGNFLTVDEEGDVFPIKENTFLESLDDFRNLLIRKPSTVYDADIYLSFEGITGLSLKRFGPTGLTF